MKIIPISQANKKAIPQFSTKDYIPVAKGAVAMLSSAGGIGKTYSAIRESLMYAIENPTEHVCVWFTEDPEGLIAHRFDCVARELNVNETVLDRVNLVKDLPFPFVYPERGKMVKDDKVNDVLDALSPYDLIILDPLLAFYGGSENDNSQARSFMQIFVNLALEEQKAILVLHHATKGTDMNPSKTRGAGAFVDACRIAYELDFAQGCDRVLKVVKDNWGVGYFIPEKKKTIKVIPSNTSMYKELENDIYADERKFIISTSDHQTFGFETAELTWTQLKAVFENDLRYCTHGFSGGLYKGETEDGQKYEKQVEGWRTANCVNTPSDLIVLDVDDGYPLAKAKVLFAPYRAYILTTKSHGKEKNGKICDRYRVVLAARKSFKLTPQEYSVMMSEIHAKFPFADKACKDIARAFTSYSIADIYETDGEETIDVMQFLIRGRAKERRRVERFEKYRKDFSGLDKDGLMLAARKVLNREWVEGNRNYTFARLCLWFRDSKSVDDSTAMEMLKALNAEMPSPLDDKEIRDCFRHKFKL